MKHKPKAESSELRAESPKPNRSRSRALAHARSLAAHKANWTSALRRAYPDGGPAATPADEAARIKALVQAQGDRARAARAAEALAAALPAELERELVQRAYARAQAEVVRLRNGIAIIEGLQRMQMAKLERLDARLRAQRREREIAATVARMQPGGKERAA